MKFRIHYQLADGSEDSIVIEGKTHEEIREQADKELEKRGGKNPWSEEL